MAFHHLPRSLLTTTTAAPPSISPPPPKSFRPIVAIIVGVLTTMFSVTFLLLLYAKHCRRRRSPAYYHHYPPPLSSHRNSGLHRSVVNSLPIFRFAALLGHKHGLECAVCLSPFLPHDLLRLLPKCRHAFHVECVDTWLDAHSTCPLCRSRVDPEDIFLLPLSANEPPRDQPPSPPPNLSCGFIRPGRISGRHSSAGEKSTHDLLQLGPDAVRKSVDDGLLRSAAPPPRRKDGLLKTTTEEYPMDQEAMAKRFGHRIVVSGGDVDVGLVPERWSDLRPSDLLFLRSEMILTGSGRLSSSNHGWAAITERCESDITGIGRRAVGRQRAEEQLALRRLLGSVAAKWLGARTADGEPNSTAPRG